METPKIKRFEMIWLSGALLLAGGLKLWLVRGDFVPFNADEAVVALMARHILRGELPIFFYGQAYMGSLDAFFAAGAFALFGQYVWPIRLVQGLLYLGTLATTAWLGRDSFGSWRVGIVAACLLAIPTVNVSLYTTASLGGYGEALLLGNLIVLVGVRIGRCISLGQGTGRLVDWLILGVLAGVGVWAFGFTLVFSVPVAIYLLVLLWQMAGQRLGSTVGAGQNLWARAAARVADIARVDGRVLGMALAGVVIGSFPWWWYAFRSGFGVLIQELGGSAIAGVEGLPWIFQVGQHLVSLVVLGSTVIFGLRPPWGVVWLGLPLLPFVMIFWTTVIVYIVRRMRIAGPYRGAQAVLLGVMVTLSLGFLFTPFGADPSGRYFIPLIVPLALFGAGLIVELEESMKHWALALIALVMVYNLWGTVQCAYRYPPGITTQFYAPAQVDHRYMDALIEFLHEKGETRGYTNYWVSYPLAFLSQEDLIFVPRLPYHTDFRYTQRDDRYAPYGEMVEAASRVAYITTHHPDLDQRLRESFTALGITWQEARIGDYQVFYALSRLVRPQDLDFLE